MPIKAIAHAVPEHETGRFVFFDEGKKLGTAHSISGLHAAVQELNQAGLRNFPDLGVGGADADLKSWSTLRAKKHTEKWDCVIRDNPSDGWVQVRGGWTTDGTRWIIDSIELIDGPGG